MLIYIKVLIKLLFQFHSYKPQPVTLISTWRWLSQFPWGLRPHLFSLLKFIIYFTEDQTIDALVAANNQIISRLQVDGYDYENVIYISIDEAGSSSHVMLNLLRDAINLERKGARLIDSRDVKTLPHITSRIQRGAIIYIDDFAGSGKQFVKNHNWTADYITGSFAEFFIAPCMCEEALRTIESIDVEPVSNLIHYKSDRPLHEENHQLDACKKEDLISICNQINPEYGLGFMRMATMVVFYRNSPNTMPLIFRGNLGQDPLKGIFPRSNDLPYM